MKGKLYKVLFPRVTTSSKMSKISSRQDFLSSPSFLFHVTKGAIYLSVVSVDFILLSWNRATYWDISFHPPTNSCRSMVLELRKRYLNEFVQFSLHWGIFCILLQLCCQVCICIKIMIDVCYHFTGHIFITALVYSFFLLILLNGCILSCNCVFYLIRYCSTSISSLFHPLLSLKSIIISNLL